MGTTVNNIPSYTCNFLREQILSILTTQKKVIMKGNGCANLTIVIISQCIHTLNHIVHLKKNTVKIINIQNKQIPRK